MWQISVTFLILLIVLLSVEGRGGRGGGGRGGGRGGSRGGSRSSRSSSSRVKASVARYRGPVYRASSWNTMAGAATLYGLKGYKRRSMYLKHPESEPTVCFNAENLREESFGYFICPEPDQNDDMIHCCGESGDQICCTKDPDESEPMSAFTIFVEVISVIAIIAIAVCVCLCR